MLDKKAIRRELLARRQALSLSQAAGWSTAIRDRVETLPEFEAAPAILTYVASKDNEVDTTPLIRSLLDAGRPVLVPATLGGGQMVWSRLADFSELEPATFGVLEPRKEFRRDMPPPQGSIVLVPGLAFTREGWRIGYGGGYFDRFLAGFPGPKIALAYSLQLIPDIPVEAHDVPMDIIVTEEAVYRCRRHP